ncbi:MAG: type II toxin-antitoxin system Phd/YefM family antitoxin [Pseudonocardiales bacterium]|nr:type II toxin-antitoxin system Phd/YefM family antitoxin [Pseudonocardiales bacterium]
MTTLPLAEVKARLSAVLDELGLTHERVVITRNGRPEAVLLSLDDLESIEETIDVLATPGLRDQLDAAAAEIERGDWISAEELAQRHRGPR